MSLKEHLAIEQSSQRTCLVLSYEVGDIAKCLIYQESFPSLASSYREEMKLTVADAITMLRLFCEQEHISFDESALIEVERFKERQKEICKAQKEAYGG